MHQNKGSEKIERIIKDTTKFSAASYLANLFDFCSAIVLRRLLGPLLMGVFAELMLIFQYTKYYHLGVYEALDREIPYFNGQDDHSRVERIKSAGLNFAFFVSLCIGLGLIIVSIFLKDRLLALGIPFVAALVVIQSVVTFFIISARTTHKFSVLSRYNFLFSFIGALLTIILVIRFKLTGALCALVLVNLFALGFFLANGFHVHINMRQDFKEVKRLLYIGFPILLYGFIFTTLTSADRFMIIAFLGNVNLGYYSIATMVAGYMILIPNLIYTVLFPRFYEAFGREGGDMQKLKYQFLTPTLIIAYLLPLPIGLAGISLPFIVKYLLPQYAAGLMPSYIMLVAAFFISVLGMSSYVLIALNKQMRMVFIGIFAIAIALVSNYLLVKVLGFGLNGVATSMLLAYFFYSVFIIGFAFSRYTKKITGYIKLFIELYLPIIFITAVLFLLHSLFKDTNTSVLGDVKRFLSQAFVLLLAYIPLFYYINKKTAILGRILRLLKLKFIPVK